MQHSQAFSAQTRRPIAMSVFELLKAGPGPSSSHTIGPMRAGLDFSRRALALDAATREKAVGVRVRLYGSLSATGQGHGTDRAVVAGLMGNDPTDCPPSLLNNLSSLAPEKRVLRLGVKDIPVSPDCMHYGPVQHDFPYSNTLIVDLLDVPYPPPARSGADAPGTPDGTPRASYFISRPEEAAHAHEAHAQYALPPFTAAVAGDDPFAGNILFSFEYYSTGGGFLQWKGWHPEEHVTPPYPYANTAELHVRLLESGLALDELLLENECALTGASRADVLRGLDRLLELMKDSVARGCAARGLLPGALKLLRKAGVLFERAGSLQAFDRKLCLLNAYAYAAAEENAAGNIIVTAPTCGAAGVVPAVAMFMQEHLSLDASAQRKGLLAAAVVGFIAKQNAGIAGAEVGCQGEVGVASAMAAAMLAEARGYSPKVVENAAEIALEHHLGLTCDPVGGYVQIPCIERNAVGAVKAYNAALVAANENPAAHMVGYDEVLQAMLEIGRDMNSKYKETSTGGLAVCLVAC